MAISRNTLAKNASTTSPPERVRMSDRLWLLSTRSPASVPIEPMTSPPRNSPALQAISPPRCSRNASAERVAQPAVRRAGAGGQQAGAEVAPREQRERDGHEPGGGGEAQQQRPPALVVERAGGARPADRRQPRQRAVARVPGRAQQERDAEDHAGEPVRGAHALGQLARDRADAGEHDPARGQRSPEGDRAGRRQAHGDQAERDDRGDRQVHRDDDRERGGQRCAGADRAGAHQLRAPALLLGPRVAADQEHVHQGDDHGERAAGPPCRHAADRVQRPRRPVDRRVRAVAGDRRGEVGAVGGGGVEVLEARGRDRARTRRRARCTAAARRGRGAG